MAAILLSIVLAQERERRALSDRVASLEARLDDRDAGGD
jgi:BMFP domain-containing protein YqiC